MHAHTNALARETSPYLLQHAHNPVDWMPWGEEALERARRENKLLLISIGYAACHWCHVMERESFENEAVAAVMNADFVCIKVDREERPDVDDLYMQACQLSGGGGCGWPLNAIALPDARPFWAGTYFPPERWTDLLANFLRIRAAEPERLEAYARQIHEQLEVTKPLLVDANQQADPKAADRVAEALVAIADPRWGGFGGAPKFPLPVGYAFMLDYVALAEADAAAQISASTMLEKGLLAMAQGGIYDQLGGGFSRYSVDARWHVPHFEKMLYDNGQLLSVYARAFRQNPNLVYALVVRETIDWLTRELCDPTGLYYSSLDADSEGEEGTFYVWSYTDLRRLLTPEELTLAEQVYQITPEGNWEHGKNVLHTPQGRPSTEAGASTQGDSLSAKLPSGEAERFERLRAKLLAERNQRIRPALDDKLLVSWNGLTISGLVDSYLALREPAILAMAATCAERVREVFLQPDGSLLRTHARGRTHVNAFLDDYANYAQGCLDLYGATFELRWLELAEALVAHALLYFGAEHRVLLYYTSVLDTGLVARRLEDNDNVMPASNSVMASLLYELGLILDRSAYVDRARRMLAEVHSDLLNRRQALYWSRWHQLQLRLDRPHFELAIVGPQAASLRLRFATYILPQVTFLGATTAVELPTLAGKFQEGQTWIYVCEHGACQAPTQVLAEALQQIGRTA